MKETGIIMSGHHPKLILDGIKTQTRRVVSPSTSVVGVGKVDWSNFDWGQKTECDFGDSRYSTESEFVPDELKGQLIGVKKAPAPLIDGNVEKYHYQYLHVPYRWSEDATIYRIYPKWDIGDRLWVRETFCAGYPATESGIGIIPELGKITEGLKVVYKAGSDYGEDPPPWRPSIFMPRWASRITLEITEVRVERVQEISENDAQAEGVIPEPNQWDACYLDGFIRLWDSLNAKRGYGWEVNPWVWVVTFKLIKGEGNENFNLHT